MNIKAKTSILATCALAYKSTTDTGWQDMLSEWDVSFPLAVAVAFGYATLTDKGIGAIEDCYAVVCDAMGIDPSGTYADYSEWIASSPNEEV